MIEAPSVAHGWSALAKIMNEIDEGRITDCKEDVDTLLVFAGLFSAVTTAFIIESYKGLQEDPTEVTVQLLRQLVFQTNTYQIQAGFLNSSAAVPPTAASFEPPSSAIWINVLWFMSLVFSLITASFGMLVKQWLREYLSSERIGPKARLRIRHFRYPGLTEWKVFEIVAILPLLLQTALGLFLLGLCFFTSSIHRAVGRACLPLVAGWAFFFIAATLLPSFSSRCPYKTTLLKGVTRYIRPRCYTVMLYTGSYVHQGAKYIVRVVMWGLHGIMRPLTRTSIAPEIQPIQINWNLTEEDEIIAGIQKDVEILVSTDALLLDDDILTTVLFQSLQEMQPSGRRAIDFVQKVIGHRLSNNLAVNNLPADLRPLTKNTWETMMEIVHHALAQEFEQEFGFLGWEPWMGDAILLLLSQYNLWDWKKISDKTSHIIRRYLTRCHTQVCKVLASAPCLGKYHFRSEGFAAIYLDNVGNITKQMFDGDSRASFSFLEAVVGWRICGQNYDAGTFKLSRFLHTSWRSSLTDGNLRNIAQTVIELLQQSLKAPSGEWGPWMTEAAKFLVNFASVFDDCIPDDAPIIPASTRLALAFVDLLVDPHAGPVLFECFAGLNPRVFARNFVLCVIHGIYFREQDVAGVLHNLHNSAGTPLLADNISPVRSCHVVLRTIRLPEAYTLSAEWRQLLSAMAKRMEHYREFVTPEDIELAEICIRIVHSLDCHDVEYHPMILDIPDPRNLEQPNYFAIDDEASYANWLRGFNPDKSLFPDDFVLALSKIATGETGWYRVRRLKETGMIREQDSA